jgi:Fe-S cluster biogenesis protein NfuA/nitrite reductase/ring-hydroxylating ferredoxin subunit
MADRLEEMEGDAQWRSAGDRIQTLLDATSAGGTAARERAEQLVGEVVELYGAGLARILAAAADQADPGMLNRLVADDLVASLLLVHGLHPHDVHRRVSDALDKVRPYLGSHGGDVHLLDIVDDTVQLQFAGSCKSCPSSAVTLELAVEDAIRAAAPEISSIDLVTPETGAASATVISAESLLAQVHSRAQPSNGAAWHQVPDVADLAPGEVGGFSVAGVVVLACRVGDLLYAYRDHCPACDGSLAGAALHRRVAGGDPVLRCPRCHAHFDVVHAGAGLDEGAEGHLDPIPLLLRDGVLSLAVPAEPMGAPA